MLINEYLQSLITQKYGIIKTDLMYIMRKAKNVYDLQNSYPYEMSIPGELHITFFLRLLIYRADECNKKKFFCYVLLYNVPGL